MLSGKTDGVTDGSEKKPKSSTRKVFGYACASMHLRKSFSLKLKRNDKAQVVNECIYNFLILLPCKNNTIILYFR